MAKSQHKTGIFFFDNPHHIYHAASIAFELAKIPNQDVAIYCSTNINYETSVSLAKRYLGENFIIDFPNLSIELVLPSLFYRITRYFKKRPFPGRASVFNRHQDKFLSCDTLASPADAILKLKKQKKFLDKSFVYTHHGAGDRDRALFASWIRGRRSCGLHRIEHRRRGSAAYERAALGGTGDRVVSEDSRMEESRPVLVGRHRKIKPRLYRPRVSHGRMRRGPGVRLYADSELLGPRPCD